MPDWTCRYCLDGAYHMCARHDMYGFKRATPGAMASYMVFTTDALVHKVSATSRPPTPPSPSPCPARCTASSAPS